MSTHTATLTNVSGSATSVALFAANPKANSRTIFNDSASVLYVKFGTTASATSFTVKLEPNDYFEFPDTPFYTGVVHGIWTTATGTARVTQVV